MYIFVHLLLDNRSCLLSGSIYSFFLSCSTWEVFLLCQKASSVVICRYRQMHWFLLLAFIFFVLVRVVKSLKLSILGPYLL